MKSFYPSRYGSAIFTDRSPDTRRQNDISVPHSSDFRRRSTICPNRRWNERFLTRYFQRNLRALIIVSLEYFTACLRLCELLRSVVDKTMHLKFQLGGFAASRSHSFVSPLRSTGYRKSGLFDNSEHFKIESLVGTTRNLILAAPHIME